jgi:antitoxin PrlF
MASATVTSKGQITIPAEIRKALKIKPGTRIVFYETGPRSYAMIAKTGSIRDLKGILPKLGYTPTLEEMDQAIGDYLGELDAATKSNAPKRSKDEEAA